MKLATVIAFCSSVALAAPAFACPNHDQAETPKTAEKAPAKTDQAPAKEQPKQDTAKPADTAKAKTPAKDAPKKGDKVSLK